MAQTVLTIAGAYLGSFLGPSGSTWGAQIGAAIGPNVGPVCAVPIGQAPALLDEHDLCLQRAAAQEQEHDAGAGPAE